MSTEPELIVSGPIRSAKTTPILLKWAGLHMKNPGFQSLITRPEYSSLSDTIFPDIFKHLLQEPYPFEIYGGRTRPKELHWYNGGVTYFSGMDEVLKKQGAKYDFVFCNQIEQFTEEEWQYLGGRTLGLAGNWIVDGKRVSQVVGDANPDHSEHWIMRRWEGGEGVLPMLWVTLMDNPLFYRGGDWTELGIQVREDLERRFTGVSYRRMVLGEWCGAEGRVFSEFDGKRHIITELPNLTYWMHSRSIDFGTDHPFVCQWWARNPDNGVLVNYKEHKLSNTTIDVHAKIIEANSNNRYRWTTADRDKGLTDQLRKAGIKTIGAYKDLETGIDAVNHRFKHDEILLYKDALIKRDMRWHDKGNPTNLIDEINGYIWKPNSIKDEVRKKNDDSCDAMRYEIAQHDIVPQRSIGIGSVGASRRSIL